MSKKNKIPKQIGSLKLKKKHRKAIGSAVELIEAATVIGATATALLGLKTAKDVKHNAAHKL